MFKTRAAAHIALACAASWAAACAGGSSARRAGPSSLALAESADHAHASTPAEERPGLGTEFGESVRSSVVDEPFERATAEPFAAVALHYNDAEGVAAQAASRGGALAPVTASIPQGGISIALTGESGEPLPGFSAPGRTYVVGEIGRRYNLQLVNHTGGRFEVLASVDGLDVIDGRPASYSKRGYIVPPHGSLTIDGFRTSDDTVAAFRFSAVRDSYAARTGDDRNVGVVGFAFYAERGSDVFLGDEGEEIERRESADPFPDRYAAPPPQP